MVGMSQEWMQRNQMDMDAAYRDLEQQRLNRQKAFENSQGTIASLLSGGVQGGANPFGGVPSLSQDNRFSAGLSDAESRLRALLDNPDSITNSAAYKFRVGQGQEALQRSLGAKGLLNSGNRLQELTKYGQDMGSQEYDAQYGRLSSLLGNYSQGYTADKNANTALFNAQASAWNQAQGNQDANRYRMANLAWDMNRTAPTSRTVAGMTSQPAQLGAIGGGLPVDWTAFDERQKAQRNYLDRY